MNKLDIRNIRLANFDDNFNKTRQGASDVMERGGRPCCYSDASQKKITSELAEVRFLVGFAARLYSQLACEPRYTKNVAAKSGA